MTVAVRPARRDFRSVIRSICLHFRPKFAAGRLLPRVRLSDIARNRRPMNRSRSVSETSVGLFAFLDVLMSTVAAVAAPHAAETHRAVEVKGEADKKPAPYVPPPVEPPRETVDLNAK